MTVNRTGQVDILHGSAETCGAVTVILTTPPEYTSPLWKYYYTLTVQNDGSSLDSVVVLMTFSQPVSASELKVFDDTVSWIF